MVSLRADKGGEYTGEDIRVYCLKMGTIYRSQYFPADQRVRTRGTDALCDDQVVKQTGGLANSLA